MQNKIIVCYHKPYKILKNDVLCPLHVGKFVSNCIIDDVSCDNTGDNISAKNATYCELTGLYWLWKNIDADNYGLFHYRRFLDIKNKYNPKRLIYPSLLKLNDWNNESIDSEMELYDIILPKKLAFKCSVYEQYEKCHNINDLNLVVDIIKQDYPQYIDACDKVLKGNKGCFCNMFIMKKEIFNEYCSWLFDILQKVEPKINYEEKDQYQKRVIGFLSERMFNIFIQYKIDTNPDLKIKTVNSLFIEDEPIKKVNLGLCKYLRYSNKMCFEFGNIRISHKIKG